MDVNIYVQMACHWQVLQSHSGQLLTNQLVDELNRVEAAYESRTQGSLGREIPTSEEVLMTLKHRQIYIFTRCFLKR